MVHHSVTEWWGENETLADELWRNLETSAVTIAVPDEWATEQGLEMSIRFPWDDTKGLYSIKVFHQMHCLVGETSSPMQARINQHEETNTQRLARVEQGRPILAGSSASTPLPRCAETGSHVRGGRYAHAHGFGEPSRWERPGPKMPELGEVDRLGLCTRTKRMLQYY